MAGMEKETTKTKTVWANPIGLIVVIVTLAIGAFWFKGLVEKAADRNDELANGVETSAIKPSK
jgi:hypothetical protein